MDWGVIVAVAVVGLPLLALVLAMRRQRPAPSPRRSPAGPPAQPPRAGTSPPSEQPMSTSGFATVDQLHEYVKAGFACIDASIDECRRAAGGDIVPARDKLASTRDECLADLAARMNQDESERRRRMLRLTADEIQERVAKALAETEHLVPRAAAPEAQSPTDTAVDWDRPAVDWQRPQH